MSYLRDYQEECREAVHQELSNGSRSTLYVVPTGAGKTEIALETIDTRPDQDSGVLCLAHRQELVYQPFDRWKRKTGTYGEMIMGEFSRNKRGKVNFASKDSLHADRLRREFPDPRSIGTIWVDEAHHLTRQSKSYTHIIDYFMDANPDCRLFGCTATPDRTDEEALGQCFDSVAYELPLLDPDPTKKSAIGHGWLVPIEQEVVTVDGVHFDGVGNRGGDFIDSQLEAELLRAGAVEKVTAATKEIAAGLPTICFCPGVEFAARQAMSLNAEETGCAYAISSRIPDGYEYDFIIDSSDKEKRRQILRKFGQEFQYMCNMAVLTEGFDSPFIQVVSMGRPTKSRSLYAQMLGRGTRILPGIIEGPKEGGGYWRLETAEERIEAIRNSAKPRVTILDFVGNSRHELISTADILGGKYSDEVVALAKERQKEGERDTVKALDEATMELRRRELERRKQVQARADFQRRKLDPFEVLGVVATREPGWHKGRKPTAKQVATLKKFKVPDTDIAKFSFHQASQMLDKLIAGIQSGSATYKQKAILHKHGFHTDVSFEQARATIDKIAGSRWQLRGPLG